MTGLSPRNLNYMRAFAEAWPDRAIVQQLVAQLPWGHNIRLLEALKLPEERAWYARQAVEHGWSRAVLVHQIARQHGLSDGPSALGPALQRLAAVSGLPSGTADLGETLRVLDAAAHGADVSADAAAAALDAGTRLLDALRRRLEDP
jgi:DUF1016 N-terminal domain